MSMRNQNTGRHEDDLHFEAWMAESDGEVPIVHLIEHLEEIVGDTPSFGGNVSYAARTAAYLLRSLGMQGKLDLYDTVKYMDPKLVQKMRSN